MGGIVGRAWHDREVTAEQHRAGFVEAVVGLGGDAEGAAVAAGALVQRYAEPARRYHTVAHLGAVLAEVAGLAGAEPPLAPRVRHQVVLAAWFHDAVYDPAAAGNEEASAALADEVLGGLGLAAADRVEVARLVLVTAGHAVEPGDEAAATLVDADLAVLAAGRDDYEAYRRAVRAEYAHVPDDAWRSGRAAVLDALLASPRLFHRGPDAAHREARARANLGAEREVLVSSA